MRTYSIPMLTAAACALGCNDKEHAARGQPAPAPTSGGGIELPGSLTPTQRVAAGEARDAFLAACSATPIEWGDFQTVSLTTTNASGYLKHEFDWDLMVTVTLVFKEGLDRRRGGHRVTFDMGAGKRPGIVTRKSQAIELCGFGGKAIGVHSGKPCVADGGEDCILDLPRLKALDAARKPAVVETQRTVPAAWCFGHGFDPPPFWTCTSTEKACKEARAAAKRDENDDYKVRTQCAVAESLHCFVSGSGKTVCGPNADACTTSRKEWTDLDTASACEVATLAMLEASIQETD